MTGDDLKTQIEQTRAGWAAAIEAAGVPTEAVMRESKAPTPATVEELAEYVRSLVDRPHDYGTCCYAMSLAATAAFNFVAGRLGVTGFQASCADLDILRRTRGFEWGRLVRYENLLYPQYCNAKHFPGWQELLVEHRDELAKRAAKLLEGNPEAPVAGHWRTLVAAAQPGVWE